MLQERDVNPDDEWCQDILNMIFVQRQRWDDVNCRTGAALPTVFPGQVSGQNFSEGKVM